MIYLRRTPQMIARIRPTYAPVHLRRPISAHEMPPTDCGSRMPTAKKSTMEKS